MQPVRDWISSAPGHTYSERGQRQVTLSEAENKSTHIDKTLSVKTMHDRGDCNRQMHMGVKCAHRLYRETEHAVDFWALTDSFHY